MEKFVGRRRRMLIQFRCLNYPTLFSFSLFFAYPLQPGFYSGFLDFPHFPAPDWLSALMYPSPQSLHLDVEAISGILG